MYAMSAGKATFKRTKVFIFIYYSCQNLQKLWLIILMKTVTILPKTAKVILKIIMYNSRLMTQNMCDDKKNNV